MWKLMGILNFQIVIYIFFALFNIISWRTPKTKTHWAQSSTPKKVKRYLIWRVKIPNAKSKWNSPEQWSRTRTGWKWNRWLNPLRMCTCVFNIHRGGISSWELTNKENYKKLDGLSTRQWSSSVIKLNGKFTPSCT